MKLQKIVEEAGEFFRTKKNVLRYEAKPKSHLKGRGYEDDNPKMCLKRGQRVNFFIKEAYNYDKRSVANFSETKQIKKQTKDIANVNNTPDAVVIIVKTGVVRY